MKYIKKKGKGFLEISKYYLRIRVKWGQNGGKLSNIDKNVVLPLNNGRNATRCQFACLSYIPFINYELVLPIIIIVGKI